jgi:hypothetical protein
MMASCSQGSGGSSPVEAGAPDGGLPRSALLKPQVCGSCHAAHYSDWAASMHAFAADDPVFLAMNARGQRETDGGLGTFCVNCHAPMAVRDGLTTDGLNLASLPSEYRGVTCFFCHTIDSVDGSHNASVTLAGDLAMRGEYTDPVPNSAHAAKYSTLQDVTSADSASACGACHDIVVPAALDGDAGAHIERTFAEWQGSAFSSATGLETCGVSGCHMVKSQSQGAIAQMTGLTTTTPPTNRYFHAHDFPAIDVRLTGAADAGADAAVTVPPDQQVFLSNALQGDLCVTQRGAIRVVLDTPNLGHNFPSGAAQDRRFWVEVVAYQGAQVVYQSGTIPFGTAAFDAGADPDFWLMRDCIFDSQGDEVHMFWQAASYEGNELPPLTTFDPSSPSFTIAQRVQFFPRGGGPLPASFDRVTLNLWVQPVGSDVLADLVASGDLDASVAAAMPKLPVPLSAQIPGGDPTAPLVWTAQDAADGGVIPYVDSVDDTAVQCVGTLPTPNPIRESNHVRCAP